VQSEKALAKDNFAFDLEAISRIEAIPNILEVVCRTTGLGFAAVARVTEKRWIACAVRDEIAFGLAPGGELKVETTICDEIRDSGQAVVIDHAAEDVAYCNHPTPRMYGFESYISMPIFRSGQFFGTLCAIDPRPAKLNTPEIVGMFRLFADLIAFHLDAQQRLMVSETALFDERHTAQLREQFIAVLGHDLRNPLNAITGGSNLLQRMTLGDQAAPLVSMVQRSAARMAGLIDNLMDFARGRLGGGFALNRVVEPRIQEILEQVVAEARIAWPDRDIRSEFSLTAPVDCDGARVAQLFSNLLANALIHGDPDGPVQTRVHSDGKGFQLSVTNTGEPIPPDIASRLFLPFSRATVQPNQQGLGLGLYIASEIARAHDGSLEVESSSTETCFTFNMNPKEG
jgi:signal transduction histidine kinase